MKNEESLGLAREGHTGKVLRSTETQEVWLSREASILSRGSAAAAAAAAKSLQSCPTLCDPRDGSPAGSAVPGILQTRTLEWGATAFSEQRLWGEVNPAHSNTP